MYGGGYHYKSPGLRTVAVVKTTDGWFQNWTVTSLSSHSGYIYALAIDPGNSDIIYAGGQYHDGHGNWCVGLFKSTDAGTNWLDVSSGIDDHDQPVYALLVDAGSPDTIYAGTRGGIYKSTDGGLNWNNTDCGFLAVHALSSDRPSSNTIYAGTEAGMYKSTDGGSTWSTMNQGLSVLDISSLGIHSVDANRIYAGTRGGGVFTQDVIGVEEAESPILTQNCPILYQNSPNPFSKTCTIRYFLPSASRASLRIYDNAGRLVQKLTDEPKQAGLHVTKWNGKDCSGRIVPSNLYFCQLRWEGLSATRKLLFIK